MRASYNEVFFLLSIVCARAFSLAWEFSLKCRMWVANKNETEQTYGFYLKIRILPLPITKSAGASLGDKINTIGFPRSGIQDLLPKSCQNILREPTAAWLGFGTKLHDFRSVFPFSPEIRVAHSSTRTGRLWAPLFQAFPRNISWRMTGRHHRWLTVQTSLHSCWGFLKGLT